MKCYSCQKKLKLSEQVGNVCKCGNTYCSKHITAAIGTWINSQNAHNCNWDYIKEHQLRLQKNNPATKRNSGLETI